jgi:hypothetical protein
MSTLSNSLYAKAGRAGIGAALAAILILGAGAAPAMAQGRCDNGRRVGWQRNGKAYAYNSARVYQGRNRRVNPYYANGNYAPPPSYAYRGPNYGPGYYDPYYNYDPYRRESSKTRDVLTIAGSTAGGAVVGGLLGGKKGAIIGAAAGAAASSIYTATRNRDRRPRFPF